MRLTYICLLMVYRLLVTGMASSSIRCSLTTLIWKTHSHQALQETCGTIQSPPDNGCTLMNEIQNSSGRMFGVSDALLKHGRATHAWIISSGKVDDINNPLLHISRTGMVHGIPNYLSSARGELQGITAMSIISNMFSQYHNKQIKTSAICDNAGVINKCAKGRFSSLQRNRDAFVPNELIMGTWPL